MTKSKVIIETNNEARPLADVWRVLFCALAGGLMALAFPPFPFAFLLPVAFALLLGMIEGQTPRKAAYFGFTCGMVFFGCALFWLRAIFGTGAIGLWALCAFFPMLFCAVTAWLRARLPRVPLWLLAPVAWTAIELIRSEYMKPAFPLMGLGYALVNSPFISPLASVLGCYGLTFFVVMSGAILLRVMVLNIERGPLIPCAALLILLGLFFRANTGEPPRNNPVRLTLIQTSPGDETTLLERTAQSNAQIIEWPEDGLDDPQNDKALWAKITGLAQTKKCYLLICAKVPDSAAKNNPDAFRKTALLIGPDGSVVGTHVKNHLVPFVKDGEPGTDAKAFDAPFGKIGAAICYDFDFPDIARRLTADGAEILLVPSDNPPEWGRVQHLQHRQMFQMRAIECNRWIGTADTGGNTFLIAPNGLLRIAYEGAQPELLDTPLKRLAARMGISVLPGVETPLALTDTIGRETGRTVFVQGGWLFGPLCFFGLLGLIVAALLPRKTA